MLMKKTSITEKHLFFLCNFEMNVVFVSHRFFAVLLIDCAGHVTQDEPSQKSFFFLPNNYMCCEILLHI